MIIQHNISALNSHRQLGINNSNTSKNLEKLSSGYRINRAGDDAAGLAISEKMRGQIRGLSMAEQNVSHGINLIQTAEGGLQETHAILQRMRELAVQSANGTYDDENDRFNLEKEFSALMDEIDRISESTHYNNIKLLDGSLEAGGKMKSGGWGEFDSPMTDSVTGTDSVNWSNIYGKNYSALATEMQNVIVPNIIDSMVSGMSSLSHFADADIEIGLDYTKGTSYSGQVSFGWTADSSGNSTLRLTLRLNMDFVDQVWSGGSFINTPQNDGRARFEQLLAHEMMHAVMAVTNTVGMSSGSDRYSDWFVEGMAQAMSGDMNWVSHLTGTSTNKEIQDLLNYNTLVSGSPQGNYASGYLAVMYLANEVNDAYAGSTSNMGQDIQNGINIILAELISGTSLDQVINKYTDYDGLYEFEKTMGSQTDVYDFVRDLRTATAGGSGSVLRGDLTESDIVSDTASGSTHTLLGLDIGNKSVVNKYKPGFNITNGGGAYTPGSPVDSGYNPGGVNLGLFATPPARANPNPFRGSLILQIGANGTQDQWLILNIANMSSEEIGSKNDNGMLDKSVRATGIATQDDANESIKVLDDAINMVSAERATLGAAQNRLEHTMNNLGVTKENLTAAESTIRDVDMAKEMMEYTKNSILVQAAQSMLAQAQSLPQGVLNLLR